MNFCEIGGRKELKLCSFHRMSPMTSRSSFNRKIYSATPTPAQIQVRPLSSQHPLPPIIPIVPPIDIKEDIYSSIEIEKNVPNTITIGSSRRGNASQIFSFQNDDKLPHYGAPGFNRILSRKLEVCTSIFEFKNENQENYFKELKLAALQEISSLFQTLDAEFDYSESFQEEVFAMLHANIFEQTPIFPSIAESNYYTIPIVDPFQQHLTLAFQILLKFVTLFPHSRCFTPQIVKRAVDLTSLPDVNVRYQMLAFLKTFYDRRVDQFHPLLKMIQAKLSLVLNKELPPYCVGPLLQLMIALFVKSNGKPHSNFHLVIHIYVLPLLGSPYFCIFAQQFNQLMTTLLHYQVQEHLPDVSVHKAISYSARDLKQRCIKPSFVPPICYEAATPSDFFNALAKRFPKTNVWKTVSFIDTLINWMLIVDRKIASIQMKRICTFLSKCLTSDCSMVVDKVISMIISHQNHHFLKHFSKIVLNEFFCPIQRLAFKDFLDETMLEKSSAAFNALKYLNKKYFADLSKDPPKTLPPINRLNDWVHIYEYAIINDPDLETNDAFSNMEKNEKREKTCLSIHL